MIEQLHDAGLKSEHAYIAGFASIGLSFIAWATSRKAESAGTDLQPVGDLRRAVGPHVLRPQGTHCAVSRSKAAQWVTTSIHRRSTLHRPAIRQPLRCQEPAPLLLGDDERRAHWRGRGAGGGRPGWHHPGGRGMVPCRPGATTPGMGVGGPEMTTTATWTLPGTGPPLR